MSPKLPPALENFSLLTFSSIYPLLLVSCTPQPGLEMIGKWELNPNLEQMLIPGAVLESWGAAKRMSGTKSQRNSAGHPAPLGMESASAAPSPAFFSIHFFGQNHFDSSCVRGHKQPSKKKKHFEWNPGWESPGMAPWTRPQPELCFPAVLHTESWKGKQQN